MSIVGEGTQGGKLHPHHLADMRRSGLDDETIRLSRVWSETDPTRIANILKRGFSEAKRIVPALCFPFLDANGNPTGYVRVKPDTPFKFKDPEKKPAKYLSRVGVANRVYIPPRTRDKLNDASVRLLITEGEKKALKADQEGFLCLGLVGVNGWNVAGTHFFIDDLARILWHGRRVIIAFDSDSVDNPNILKSEWLLSCALKSAGAADVRVGRIPAPSLKVGAA